MTRTRLGTFVRLKGALSPNAVGVVKEITKEDGKTVIKAISPDGELMVAPSAAYENVEQPRWTTGQYDGVRGLKHEVQIVMTQQARFRVVYGPLNSVSNVWVDDIAALSIAKHSAMQFLRSMRQRFRQTHDDAAEPAAR